MAKRTTAFTSEPETPAPDLLCPIGDSQLIYGQTSLAGVKSAIDNMLAYDGLPPTRSRP